MTSVNQNKNQMLRTKPTSSMDTNGAGAGHIRSTQSGATDDTFQTADDPYINSNDPVGIHITRLLNAGAFNCLTHQKPNDTNDFYSDTSSSSLFPLFSRANYLYVKNIATQTYQIVFNVQTTMSTFHSTTSNDKNRLNINIDTNSSSIINIRQIELPTHAQSIKMTFTFIILSSFILSTCTHIALSFIIIIYLIALLSITSMLVDLKDVYYYLCPFVIQRFIDQCRKIVEIVALEYTFQNRFHGRDQWLQQQEQNQSRQQTDEYRNLIDRQMPHVLALDKRRQSPIKKQQNNNSNAVWQCQNVNWDDVYNTLSTECHSMHPNENNKNNSNHLSKSTLDHLVANNYCYVMVHGKDKHQAKISKLKSKRKVQAIHKKTNNINSSSNNNRNRVVSEDLRESMLNDIDGLNSVQSMDAIEIIRKKSTQRNDIMNQTKFRSAPMISSPNMKNGNSNNYGNTGNHGQNQQQQFRNSSDVQIAGHNNSMYERRSRLNTYESEYRGSSSIAEHHQQHHQQHNDFLSNHSDMDPLTSNASQDFIYNDDITTSFLSDDADVSYSSTSYDNDNHNNESFNHDNNDDYISGDDESTNKNKNNNKNHKQEDMKWLDVGAKIGMRLLESEKLHQAITKSQMPSNLSSSYSGAEDDHEGNDAQQGKNRETDSRRNFDSPKHVAKPFHAMWTSPNVEKIYDDVISEDDDEDEEDGYTYSDLGHESHADDVDDVDDVGVHSYAVKTTHPPLVPPPISKRARSSGASLSPSTKPRKKIMKPLRNSRSVSLPSSPVRSKSVCSRFSETNLSLLAADTTSQLVQQFDANKYLPPSMAIHHESVVADNVNSKSTLDMMDNNTMKKKRELGRLTVKTDSLSDFPPKKSYKESTRSKIRRRLPLLPGVRMIVPIFPASISRFKRDKVVQSRSYYQFATVASSKRISGASSKSEDDLTDCLSITVLLDKSFLRSGKFAEMTMRIHDSQRHMPRHSKFPIGACVATSFGVGVLVGWRAEDDCHIIRALWQKRGNGAAHAYLNRNALHDIVEAGVGFNVGTTFGIGKVIAYVDAGRTFIGGKYIVLVKKGEGRTNRIQMELNRSDIKTCHSSKFFPVVEQIKEAAKYQLQVDTYEAAKLQRILEDESQLINETWRVFSEGSELFLSSFIKAAEEDDNIDSEIHNFLSSAITFLEDFDLGSGKKGEGTLSPPKVMRSISESTKLNLRGTGMWIVDDLFGDVATQGSTNLLTKPSTKSDDDGEFGSESYKKVYAALNTAARTIAIAQSSCSDRPNLKMALAITHEVLILIHNVIKVQQVNMSKSSVQAWQKTLNEFSEVFGSMNTRIQSIGNGIIQRLQEHGKVAKVRAICFADTLISDDLLMKYLDNGDVGKCLQRVEIAAVSANVMDTESCKQYHNIGLTLYNTLAPRNDRNQEAALRSGKKITIVAKILKILATPGRSILKLLMSNDLLEIMERVFVRIFEKENDASLTLNIYSWNFRTLRHLRILNNIAISGGLWAPVLDAADSEFTWAVSRTPTATRDYIVPISKLFSLGVARFHQLYQSEDNISTDWLDFLKEHEAVKIIQDLDAALMLSLKNLCKDVQEMMQVLPYYSSIEEDILRLIDEVDLKKELKEVGEAIVDTDKFPQYIREKSASAVSRFLDYLPKMSIPIEKREIGDDWVVTCRGRNGKDLTLSNVNIEKENLLCQVLGGENVLLPVIEEYKIESKLSMSSLVHDSNLKTDEEGNVEVSILDHVAELIRNAQNHGCWKVGSSGIVQSESPLVAGSSLQGLPLSEVLRCAIDLWENLEIDDDELLEIAIRDVSHQIQLQKNRADKLDETNVSDQNWPKDSEQIRSKHRQFTLREAPGVDACRSNSSDLSERRFNPKKDPTVLYLSMSELTCCLDDFTYRIEPAKRVSMFDPVFEGIGTLSVKNASIKIRIECRKERIKKLNEEVTVPVLQLQDLNIGLEQVNFRFKETGADWLLNKIIANFTKGITQIVRDNMKEQISLSINEVLHHLNSYIEVNPDLMLKVLGITIDDLEENVAWV